MTALEQARALGMMAALGAALGGIYDLMGMMRRSRAGVHREAGGYPVGHCPALWRDLEQPDRCQSTDQKSQSHLSGE